MRTEDVRFYVWRKGKETVAEIIPSLGEVETKLSTKGGEAFKFIIKGEDETVYRKRVSPELPLKIRITGCSKSTYWYADKIGQEYDVIKEFGEIEELNIIGRYHVYLPGIVRRHFVNICDCVIVTKENCVIGRQASLKAGGSI